MGLFYENLTAAFYGGEMGHRIALKSGTEIEPDVFNSKKNVIFEAKGVHKNLRCHLLDLQIEAYAEYYNANPTQIYFAIYRHSLDGIRARWKGTDAELFNELAEKTEYSVAIPFSIILALYTPENGHTPLVYRYNNNTTYDKCTCIRSQTINELANKPEEIIKELDLNPKSYKTKRIIAPRIKINDKRINEFPITLSQNLFLLPRKAVHKLL